MAERNAEIVKYHFLTPFGFPQRKARKRAIVELFRKEGINLNTLNYIFCTDKYLLKINQDFLKHNDLTDVITFDLSETNYVVTGEIYISIDRVRENAKNFKVSLQKEILRVMFHGALHLCGYKDKNPKDVVMMRTKEDFYLNKYHKSK
ncbi:MAG: rRNA maturation RNase YbeY [Flavitalea sp.]